MKIITALKGYGLGLSQARAFLGQVMGKKKPDLSR
jgi:hypothetical protein